MEGRAVVIRGWSHHDAAEFVYVDVALVIARVSVDAKKLCNELQAQHHSRELNAVSSG